MSTVVRFAPELGIWLVDNLDRGIAPAALVQTMVAQRMELRAAQAIVDAYVAARHAGLPLPVDAVPLQDTAPDYVYETPILAPGPAIRAGERNIRVLARAQQPLLAVLADVISPDECRKLIELARPRLKPSTIVDVQTGQDVVTDYRTSYGMFFRLEENPFIARLDRRIAELMNLPLENGEGLQILHYPAGAGSAPHFDFLQPSNAANQASIARSGQRVSTLVTYLNEVEGGGETFFPAAGWSVTPQRGNAVYFEYCNSRSQVDQRSLHSSRPVLRGEKWVASKWTRQRRFVSAGME